MSQPVETVSVQEILKILSSVYPDFDLKDRDIRDAESLLSCIRDSVVDDVLLLLTQRSSTLEEASHIRKFRKQVPSRDWAVAKSHTADIISEVKDFKSRGLRGSHTGPVAQPGDTNGKH